MQHVKPVQQVIIVQEEHGHMMEMIKERMVAHLEKYQQEVLVVQLKVVHVNILMFIL